MKPVVYLMVGGLLLGGAALGAEPSGQKTRVKRQEASDYDRAAVHGEVRVVFSTREVQVLREHYKPRYRNLPPGLQKKLARTGHLPPGWQKKLEPFPVVLERQLGALPVGYRRGVIDGYAVIYSPHTRVILDATVLY